MRTRRTAMVVLLVLVAAFWMAAKYAYKPLDKAGDCDTIKQRIEQFLATRRSSRPPVTSPRSTHYTQNRKEIAGRRARCEFILIDAPGFSDDTTARDCRRLRSCRSSGDARRARHGERARRQDARGH